MNGAELADGVVLHVEPAASPEDSYIPPPPPPSEKVFVPPRPTEPAQTGSGNDEDEDLDEFFDSL